MNKSNAKAESLRTEGNQLFGQKSYYQAMLKYNESLCLAEPTSEMMGLAYANRSAIYFEMKLHENCLRNISLAKQNNYPETNIETLNKRNEKCLTARGNTNDDMHQQLFKLSYPAHNKIPFMANCLELKVNKKFGRHIMTNKCLKVGDIVAIEEPFCKIVLNDFVHQMCSWCFSTNLMDLIPCQSCTKAMFCSDECQTKAHQSFHKYECLVNDLTTTLTTNLRMALRTFFIATSMFDDSVDDLQKFLSEHQNECTVFDVTDIDKQRAELLTVISLSANDEMTVQSSIFAKIFQTAPKLNELWSKHGDFIADFLKRQIQIATLNYHEIYVWPLKKGRDQGSNSGSLAYQRSTIPAGSGSYPLCSLLNHHCAPNVLRAFIDDKIAIVVQRPIKKGDQLFDNYGHHFANVTKDFRRIELQKQYRFQCDCDACTNNWPLLAELKIGDRMCLNKAKKCCRELGLLDANRKKATTKYRELCEIIEKNQKYFPSLETCSIMQSAAAYLEMSLRPQLQFA